MGNAVKPVPEGFRTVTPYLVIADAARAIDFYKRALGARETYRVPGPGDKIMHAEIEIGDSKVFVCDETPEMGGKSPATLKGSPVSLLLYVENADKLFKQAVAAGATERMPVTDMFWGDRFGAVVDPFGHEWQIATHVEDLAPEEIGKRAAAAFSAPQ